MPRRKRRHNDRTQIRRIAEVLAARVRERGDRVVVEEALLRVQLHLTQHGSPKEVNKAIRLLKSEGTMRLTELGEGKVELKNL